MIDAFVFDLGNVLYLFDLEIAMEYLKKEGCSINLLNQLQLKGILTKYELGKISTEEFYETAKGVIKLNADFETFRQIFCGIFHENTDTVPLARRLAALRPVYILSNTNRMHAEFLSERYPILSEARGRVYSFEEGVMKPEKRIFEIAIHRFNLNPRATLYIDDIKENTDAAATLGFKTLHYPVKNGRPILRLQEELTRLGVRV
ncbi:MAG TPA: HAD family phosphatase [Candidatus Sumerlaeota bacterium]|nr:HAD family phosphatase [Candidatus Sumerlaeota bacterium]HON50161.1 HAD family phosphatase [Candidatus Sumerlaeota bacterium]HOR63377.1 HAD family phosphatase [Candidatus Sumerlaeota bacterium]HPL74128.1 HAD family phosphatase [Candidatus Sumerlaeota bacterium]HRU54322.1 HAD family phosphatase [Candidatus Sumerlaeia bacterium]